MMMFATHALGKRGFAHCNLDREQTLEHVLQKD